VTSAAVTLADMRATGATYRQLDYWTRCGWLLDDPEHTLGLNTLPGSGYWRKWTERDRRVAALMMRLIRAGLRTGVAAQIAHQAVDEGETAVTMDGVTIAWEDPE
jgi:hypothetical protein